VLLYPTVVRILIYGGKRPPSSDNELEKFNTLLGQLSTAVATSCRTDG